MNELTEFVPTFVERLQRFWAVSQEVMSSHQKDLVAKTNMGKISIAMRVGDFVLGLLFM